jgi:peptide/nickel transport system ATP-binding protein
MYAGRIVERAPATRLFDDPWHPYAQGLIGALPPLDGVRRRLLAIPGTVPDPRALPTGCAFAPRCSFAGDDCHAGVPPLAPFEDGRAVACIRPQRLPVELAAE